MPKAGKPGTLVFDFKGPGERHDWLVAELSDLGFSAFEEVDDGIRAYVSEDDWRVASVSGLREVLDKTGMIESRQEHIPPTNWNAQWEAGIRPVEAGPFCIHPPWHEPVHGFIPICIEPKMSFGTAHHETTRLVLAMMPEAVRRGATVLDAGTGTAVLSIAARLLGAGSVVAFDIDPWSTENALENLERNSVTGVDVRQGGIEAAGEGPFDLVLANINRGVLLGMLPEFVRLLRGGGLAILSGILAKDKELVSRCLDGASWSVLEERHENDWWAVTVCRPPQNWNNGATPR